MSLEYLNSYKQMHCNYYKHIKFWANDGPSFISVTIITTQ